jgi:hypothetical protein
MIEEYSFGDLNLEENLVVEYLRDCDEDGCRMCSQPYNPIYRRTRCKDAE